MRCLIFPILVLMISVHIFASSENPKDFYKDVSVGVSGGFSIGTMFGTAIDAVEAYYGSDATARGTVNGAMVVTWQFQQFLALQSGVSFTGKGFKILLEKDVQPYEERNTYQKTKITYGEIPIILRAIFRNGYNYNQYRGTYAKAAFHLFGGVTLGVPVSAREIRYIETVRNDGSKLPTNQGEDVSTNNLLDDKQYIDSLGHILHYSFDDYYQRGEVFAMAGIAFERRFDAAGLYIEFNYNQSLLNFISKSDQAKSETASFIPDTHTATLVNTGVGKATLGTFSINIGCNVYLKALKKASKQKQHY